LREPARRHEACLLRIAVVAPGARAIHDHQEEVMTVVRTLSATSLIGDKVRNTEGQHLGKIEDLVLDLNTGDIAYAVLSFGGFMGLGDKLFAIPFTSMKVDLVAKDVVLPVSKERLEQAEGFDKDHWPNFADESFRTRLYQHYDAKPYWS